MIVADVSSRRYWLFGFDQYYPAGGLADRIGQYPTLAEAQEAGRRCDNDSWSVYDVLADRTVYGDWDEPEPVNLRKSSPGDAGPIRDLFPSVSAASDPIRFAVR